MDETKKTKRLLRDHGYSEKIIEEIMKWYEALSQDDN